ncbi:MAG: LptA/OstA family protein [Campylobacterota bacterium]
MKQLTILLLLSSVLFAQNIEITAQNFKADEKEGYTEFTGQVNIIDGSSELNASRVIVFFEDVEGKKVAKRYEAYEDVSFYISEDASKYRGTCQKLFYHPQRELYQFYIDVDLYDIINKRTVRGDEVEVDMQSGKAIVVGSEDKPVKFIFQTGDNNATDDN